MHIAHDSPAHHPSHLAGLVALALLIVAPLGGCPEDGPSREPPAGLSGTALSGAGLILALPAPSASWLELRAIESEARGRPFAMPEALALVAWQEQWLRRYSADDLPESDTPWMETWLAAGGGSALLSGLARRVPVTASGATWAVDPEAARRGLAGAIEAVVGQLGRCVPESESALGDVQCVQETLRAALPDRPAAVDGPPEAWLPRVFAVADAALPAAEFGVELDPGLQQRLQDELARWAERLVAGERPMRFDSFAAHPRPGPGRATPDLLEAGWAFAQLSPALPLGARQIAIRLAPNPSSREGNSLRGHTLTLPLTALSPLRGWVQGALGRAQMAQERTLDPTVEGLLVEVLSIRAAGWLGWLSQGQRMGPEQLGDMLLTPELLLVPERQRVGLAREGGAPPELVPAPAFVDIAAETGLAALASRGMAAGPEGERSPGFHQESSGSGLAVGDIDGDGDPDVWLGDQGGLLLNDDGLFVEGGPRLGLEAAQGHQPLLFDLEGDGDLDVWLLSRRGPSQLWRQDEGRFVEVAAELGLQTTPGAEVGTIFDADGDGDLDLFAGYYGIAACHQQTAGCPALEAPREDGRDGSPAELWLWQDGRYTRSELPLPCWALAATPFDYDGDGLLDLHVSCDFGPNALFRNQGGGRFVDVACQTGADDHGASMNSGVSDVDGDGWLDLYVANIDLGLDSWAPQLPCGEERGDLLTVDYDRPSNQLLLNRPDPSAPGGRRFVDASDDWFPSGSRGWSWGGVFFDADQDGFEDFLLANGWTGWSRLGSEPNQFFLGRADHLAPTAGGPLSDDGHHRAIATLDWDQDGDTDLLVGRHQGPPMLLRNDAAQGHWLQLELTGAAPNPGAVGARVSVFLGERQLGRVLAAGAHYKAQSEPVLGFGLGSAAEAEVEVVWPGGTRERFGPLEAGGRHSLVQGAGRSSP